MKIHGYHTNDSQIWNPQTESLNRSNDYLKKKGSCAVEHVSAFHLSTLSSLKPQIEVDKIDSIKKADDISKQKKASVSDWFKETFEKVTDWFQEKWNDFLVFIGARDPKIKTVERDRSNRARIMERTSMHEIDEDFKYLDITTMDPLKAMIALLVKQGELRQEQAELIYQKVLLMQEDMKDLHHEKMKIQAELAVIGERSGVIQKVNVGLSVAQTITSVASAAMVVATAATIATGGVAAPLLVVTAVFNGLLSGGKAFHAWLKGDVKEKMDKLESEMLKKSAAGEQCQFQIRLQVSDVKNALNSVAGLSEIGSSLLSSQYGK